ncbi:tripartite tricarboxylate transporter substrate-binding protein [Cupriavidus sp. RAF12]|uniref:tripartite tricarboxylate transporter substrate-binding protein n=1 Tax=Cupriavidus sp. RAF12 TaxID=3233050 RepID=UPI003F8EE907
MMCVLLSPLSSAYAQAYPARPVTLIVPFAPGGVVDKTARQIQDGVSRRLGQSVVIENHGGAGGTIGSGIVARSAADGYTIGLVYDSYATEPLVYPDLSYRAGRDLTGVSYMVRAPMVLVVPANSPYRTLADYVAASKKTGLSYASVGAGSSNHMTAELFHETAGKQGPHPSHAPLHVPYRGGGPALNALLGGHVDSMFASLPLVLTYIESGKLRALAISATARHPRLRGVPTFAETYPGFVTYSWVGMIAPARTPAPALAMLAAAVHDTLRDPATSQRLAEDGFEVVAGGPDQMNALVGMDTARWAQVVRGRAIPLQ